MSNDAVKAALEELPDPSYLEGTTKLTERFAIQLPDGDVGALDDKTFVDWLLAHAEDAPFGDKGETKVDKKVRAAKRLVARGKADVSGFDVKPLLPEIEAVLSPQFHLDAQLEDVLVYEKGGKFARHKDTPRTANLVGTLVVGLPIAHEGGAFSIVDGGKKHVVDWSSKKPDAKSVQWVALFSDLDHAIAPVKTGSRVTLVYSLSRSDRPRADATRDKRLNKLRTAVESLKVDKKIPLMIACTRHIVTDGKQPQSIDTLRGTDREIADVFIDAGFDVKVRACVVGDDEEGGEPTFPDTQHMYAITRLSKSIPADVIAGMGEIVSFTDGIDLEEYADEEGEGDAGGTALGEYVLDTVWMEHWIIRKRAAATVIYEGMYSDTGYFGNEGSIGHIYTLAALEISAGKPKVRVKKAIASAKPKPKAKAKPKAKSKRR